MSFAERFILIFSYKLIKMPLLYRYWFLLVKNLIAELVNNLFAFDYGMFFRCVDIHMRIGTDEVLLLNLSGFIRLADVPGRNVLSVLFFGRRLNLIAVVCDTLSLRWLSRFLWIDEFAE